MRDPQRRLYLLLGLVVGTLIASLIAVWLWPDDTTNSDREDRTADATGTTEQGARAEEPTTTVATNQSTTPGTAPTAPPPPAVDLPSLDLSAANRRAPIDGLPDWSRAGYRGGEDLPTEDEFTVDERCRITAGELADEFSVRPDDGIDDTAGLQAAIDEIGGSCSPSAAYDRLSLIELPPGDLDVSAELSIDADYLAVRGAGNEPSGTRVVYRPDETTRYDTLTDDGSDWDEDAMEHDDGSGGWIWPGRGLIRVQSRAVHEDYVEGYESAPDNRKDLFEGTVNVHWKAGVELRSAPGDEGFAARAGDTVVHLSDDADLEQFTDGGYVNIRAANSLAFYEEQHALPTEHELQNLHMRQQLFTIAAVDPDGNTLTIDEPLEYDLPVDSTSDGSDEIDGDVYESKASPLVDPVVGVGLEGFTITQALGDAIAPATAAHDYANLAPAEAMHGIVFKWAADGWVRGVTVYMSGSHPIVTEEAKNLEIVGNYLDGAWNKGAGGNGYLRGSRVWDSLYAGNVLRNLRHATFQWSSSGNVFIGNDVDADLNLHGGWERNNLFDNNVVRVPAGHRSGNCSANCGGEGGGTDDGSAWHPIWWGAGQKAVKWSGATGPRNVFFNNTMSKQLDEGGDFEPFYSAPGTVFQFGWEGEGYQHLSADGEPIADWAGREQADYTDGQGVDASLTDPGPSLFLESL